MDLDKNLGMGAFLNDDYIGISGKVYFDADVDPCWWIYTEDLSNGMVQESDLRPCNEEHDHSDGSGRRLGSASYESEHDDQFFHSRPASRRLLTDPNGGDGGSEGGDGGGHDSGPPNWIKLSEATTIVEGGDNSSSVYFELDVAATGGSFTLTPTANNITFYPLSVTVEEVLLPLLTNFTMAADDCTAADTVDIIVDFTGSDASNMPIDDQTGLVETDMMVSINLLKVTFENPQFDNIK